MKQTNTEIAERLDDAAMQATAIKQVSQKNKISLADAYEIQEASLRRRCDRGERIIGIKMGFTSKAKMEQMGVNDLIWGRLTDKMQYQDGDSINVDQFIHPRAEPEIAFLLRYNMDKPITLEQAPGMVYGVAGAIEVIDSRYQNFKFSLEDVIADNCSSAAFVLGQWYRPTMDMSTLDMSLSVNGKIAHEGQSSAILGNPWQSLVDAVRLTLEYGQVLKEGMIVLAGAATPAVHIKSGDNIVAGVDQLGTVNLSVK